MDMLGKPASFTKRFIALFIDIVVVAVLYILISYITTPIANETVHYDDYIAEVNACLDEYYDSAVDAGIVTYDETTKKYTLVEGMTAESPEYKEFMEQEKIVELNRQYGIALNKVETIEMVKFMIDTLCAEIVFFLVIPLVRKDKATLGKMAMKLSIINKGDYKASNLQIVARFLSIYLIETVFSYFFFGAIAIVIIPLVNIGFYSFDKHKIFIHDFFAGTKVVETESSVIFDTLEEKEEYYIQKAKNDEEYALKREEQRKISGINMDGYNEK